MHQVSNNFNSLDPPSERDGAGKRIFNESCTYGSQNSKVTQQIIKRNNFITSGNGQNDEVSES